MKSYLQVDRGVVTGTIQTSGEFKADDLPEGRVMVEVDPEVHALGEQHGARVEGLPDNEKIVALTDETKASVQISKSAVVDK